MPSSSDPTRGAQTHAGSTHGTVGLGDHKIVPYDERWPALARALIARLQTGLGAVAIRLDHIGSTSVIGLGARPIIDVQVSVHDVLDRQAFEPSLVALGYRHFPFPELPIDDYLLFTPADGSNTEHIAVCTHGSWHELRHLALRDFLRVFPDAAARYEAAKRKSARAAEGIRERYSAGKNDTVQALEREALAWATEPDSTTTHD